MYMSDGRKKDHWRRRGFYKPSHFNRFGRGATVHTKRSATCAPVATMQFATLDGFVLVYHCLFGGWIHPKLLALLKVCVCVCVCVCVTPTNNLCFARQSPAIIKVMIHAQTDVQPVEHQFGIIVQGWLEAGVFIRNMGSDQHVGDFSNRVGLKTLARSVMWVEMDAFQVKTMWHLLNPYSMHSATLAVSSLSLSVSLFSMSQVCCLQYAAADATCTLDLWIMCIIEHLGHTCHAKDVGHEIDVFIAMSVHRDDFSRHTSWIATRPPRVFRVPAWRKAAVRGLENHSGEHNTDCLLIFTIQKFFI